jgi:type IV pilus assembly protein PilC
MVRQMVAAGEATGTLDVMLARVADLYDDEVHTAAANLLALLEPMLMLFLGIVVGGLVMWRSPVLSDAVGLPIRVVVPLEVRA